MDAVIAAIAGAVGKQGRVTVLTGAGVSQESGVATFRELGGVWEQVPVEEVATPQGFAKNPQKVLDFYNARRQQLATVGPNPGHEALADLEEALGDRFTLITQNVDDLHERAGSKRVLHMHGELRKARCVDCGMVTAHLEDIHIGTCCPCGGQLRPHIVWFGEMPFFMDREIPSALQAEVFMSIGTSGMVYPAAGFVAQARANGRLTVEINLEPSENASLFAHQVRGKSGKRLPELMRALLPALSG